MKYFRYALIAVLWATVIALVIRYAGARDVVDAIIHSNAWLLPAAAVLFYLNFLIRAWRWKILLAEHDTTRTLGELYSIQIMGRTINNFMPLSGGDLFRVFLVQKHGKPESAESMGTIAMEKALDITIVVCLAAAFLTAFIGKTFGPVAYSLIGGITLILLFVLFTWSFPAMYDYLSRIWKNHTYRRGLTFIDKVFMNLRTLCRNGRLLAQTSGLTLVFWLIDGITLWCILSALGIFLPWWQAVFVDLLMGLFAAIPITPGAIGQGEVAGMIFLPLFSVGKAAAGAAILLGQAISFWSILLIGGTPTFFKGGFTLLKKFEGGTR